MKKSFIVKSYINESIKEGDVVYIRDGSGFSIKGYNRDAYIVFSYRELFNTREKVEFIPFTVSRIGVTNRVIQSSIPEMGYVQDIELKAPNGRIAYTCSDFVYKK